MTSENEQAAETAITARDVYRQARDQAAKQADYDVMDGLDRLSVWMREEPAVIRYQMSALPSVGPFGGRAMKVVFIADLACAGVRVRVVAFPGRVMPTSASDGVPILEATLSLHPGVPDEHRLTIPRSVKRPYWVRCFAVAGQAQLIDPPVTSLQEA